MISRGSARASLVAFLCVAFVLPAGAEQYHAALGQDGRVAFPFGHSEPIVVCRPLHVCDIKLAERESVLNVAVGDSVRWIVASAQSGPGGTTPHIFVKPTQYDLQTNLVITTTRHDYYIDLSSARGLVGPSRISFFYPEDDARAQQEAKAAAKVVASPSPELDRNYRIYGDPEISPHEAYSDGAHLYLVYLELPNDLPVPFGIATGGGQQIINYRINGSTFIIDGLPDGVDLVLNAGTGRHGRGERRAHVRRS